MNADPPRSKGTERRRPVIRRPANDGPCARKGSLTSTEGFDVEGAKGTRFPDVAWVLSDESAPARTDTGRAHTCLRRLEGSAFSHAFFSSRQPGLWCFARGSSSREQLGPR